MKLTDLGVKKLPAPSNAQVDYFDTLLPAFGVRVSPKGTKTYFVMTRISGSSKLCRISIGRYPELGLSDAREAARSALQVSAAGRDPRKKSDPKSPISLAGTERFDRVSQGFLESHVRRRLRASTIRQYEHTLGVICSRWHAWPLSSVTKREVLTRLDELESDGKFALSDATYRYLNRFFRWCVERDYLERSPTEGIRRTHRIASRARFLDVSEIAEIWSVLHQLGYPFGPLLQLLLLTGQRLGEVAGMRWNELHDLDGEATWEIPANRTKNNRPHLVPLTPLVIRIIRSCPKSSDFVFSSTGRTPASGFSKAKMRLSKLMGEARTARGESPDLPDWRFHDFRRSFATHANETLGAEPHIVEAVLNHVSGTRAGIAGVYNRATYMSGRREALNRWSKFVQKARTVE